MSKDHLALFPDTNGLLHYPPLTDVDWLSICDAKKVTIVFCMQVIHELDEKKDDPGLGSRAERVIKEVDRIRASNVVREGVLLEIFNQELRANEFADSLSPGSGDDRIVHLVKKYVETTGDKDIAVYSEDMGMSLRCEAHGIPVVKPDKATRLENPQTEQGKKYKAAITELNTLKNQVPVIGIRVADPDGEPDFDAPFIVELASQVELVNPDAATEAERERLWLESGLESDTSPTPTDPLVSALDQYTGQDKAERQRYEREAMKYLDRYRRYADETNELKGLMARSFMFKVHVINSGRCPAIDLDITLVFPPVLQFMAAEKECRGILPDAPEQPKPPKPIQRGLCWPGGIDLGGWDTLRPEAILDEMPAIIPRGCPWSEIGGDGDSGFVIHIHIPKLNHHNRECFGEFMTLFKTWDDARPFEVAATVMAGNLVDKTEWKIPFVVKITG